jgi:predicted DNA-binding transcriptional regulator YafY
MAKKPTLHPYADRLSFTRLLLLIATLVRYPGVGSPDPTATPNSGKHHDALEAVKTQLREFAAAQGVDFPDDYPSLPTLRKDLQALRDYGILDRRMYRWGYYLGTGAMSHEELKVAFNALASQAEYQGDPQVRQIYQTLERRLRGLDLDSHGNFFYPVRASLNRPIIYTDPTEMIAKGKLRHTLFHCLETVENAIALGQPVELYRMRDPYQQRLDYLQVYPLQLFYHDIAWYLLYEEYDSGHLAVQRIDRCKNYCQILDPQGRGQAAQWESLNTARALMQAGWGIYLGEPEPQKLERQGKLPFANVKVRFFPPSATFILEGECRHPSQKIHGDEERLDYTVKLPPRSLPEFSRWVYRHMGNAQVLSPPELVEKHRQAALRVYDRYH